MHAALKSALEELSQTQLADDPCTDTFEMDVLSRGAIWKMAVAPDLLIPAPSTLRGHLYVGSQIKLVQMEIQLTQDEENVLR